MTTTIGSGPRIPQVADNEWEEIEDAKSDEEDEWDKIDTKVSHEPYDDAQSSSPFFNSKNVSIVNQELGNFPRGANFGEALRCFHMEGNVIKPTISLDVGTFPKRLKSLVLKRNTFIGGVEGGLNVSQLTGALLHLTIEDNTIGGVIDFKQLPICLKVLVLSRNGFKGCLDLTNLPKNLEEITVIDERMEGVVDLTHLPHKLSKIILRSQSFTGRVVLTSLPHNYSGPRKLDRLGCLLHAT